MRRETLAEGWVGIEEGFVHAHGHVMEALLEELPLRQEELTIFGRPVLTPRLTSWHGDAGARYRYSRRLFEPAPWTPTLRGLCEQLERAAEIRFNSVLVNYYRDGADSMGAHADDEPELGPSPDDVRIASVSLGARRRFVLTDRQTRDHREWQLGEGSLFLMGGRLQRRYTHRVPKTRRVVGPRLNLTFRLVRASPLVDDSPPL